MINEEKQPDAYAAAGWVKCPRSGVEYHPAYDIGCGCCKPCVEAAEAVEAYKKESGGV